MNHATKNKLLTGLVILLLAANAATIAVLWLNRPKQQTGPKGSPQEFLVKELNLSTEQQQQLQVLVKAHQQGVQPLRGKIRTAKEALFNLLKQSNVTDSTKQTAAKAVSMITEELDLLTLDHFQQVRAICTADQQNKFDEIIHQVTSMMGQPGPPGGGREGDRPPPPRD